jgi:hypothetical protein
MTTAATANILFLRDERKHFEDVTLRAKASTCEHVYKYFYARCGTPWPHPTLLSTVAHTQMDGALSCKTSGAPAAEVYDQGEICGVPCEGVEFRKALDGVLHNISD